MGLHEDRKPLGQYLAIKHGGIVMESKEPKEGYEEISVHNPETDKDQPKWIKRFASLDGKIKNLEWYEREWKGKKFMGLSIHVKDGGEHFFLDLPFDSRAYDTFTYVMDSIDYEQPVEFVAFKGTNPKTGADTTVFLVKQNGANLQWNYTRDNPGDCPPAKQSKLGKWNFDDRREWLQERLVGKIIPHVKSLNEFDDPEPEYDNNVDGYTGINMDAEPPEVMGDPDSIPF